MNSRTPRRLVCLYPAQWRTRYAQEFQNSLEAHPLDVRAVFNVIGWAVYERFLSLRSLKMDRRQNCLLMMFYADLAAISAGINFYLDRRRYTTRTAMRDHAALFTSWNIVRAGSLLAVVAVAMAGLPMLVKIVKTAFATREWSVVHLLALSPSTASIVLVWMLVAARLSGGHWVPTSWDVTGDWTAPQNWPSTATRWALGSVTAILMALGLIVSGVSVRQAIRRLDLSRYAQTWFTSAFRLLAASVAMMALGVLAWGRYAEQYSSSAFHGRDGGFFSSTNFASWTASCVVFLVATAIALRGASSASRSDNDYCDVGG